MNVGQTEEKMSGKTKHLLNCTNCPWWLVVESDAFMNVDYQRECHEESIRNALTIGPYCPKGAVAIVRLPDDAEVDV